MNIKVTIVKHYLNKKETYTTLELAEVVRRIKQQIYESVCREVRERHLAGWSGEWFLCG